MHEVAICEKVVKAILEESADVVPPGRLKSARIAVGDLHQVVPGMLDTAYEVLTRGTPLEGSRLEIRQVPIQGHCRSCDWQGPVAFLAFQCGECGEVTIEVTGGREMFLENLEVEMDDA